MTCYRLLCDLLLFADSVNVDLLGIFFKESEEKPKGHLRNGINTSQDLMRREFLFLTVEA